MKPKYELTIRDRNIVPHMDIEQAIEDQKDGLFTFTIRINNGNIVDFTIVEYANFSKYFILKSITLQELNITHNIGKRSGIDPIRDDNLQRGDPTRTSQNGNTEYSEE